jgi:ABC-type antimicrobial peptide transport system permease subunit
VSDVKLVTPLGVVPGAIKVDDTTFNNRLVMATNARLPDALNHTVHYGEFWDEDNETANTVVLGYRAAVDLFGEQVPLGRSLTFHGQSFLVRGVLARFNSSPLSPTASFDHAIFIPYQTAASLTHNNGGLYVVLAKAQTPRDLPDAIKGITARLRHAHGGQQDFSVLSPEQNIAGSSEVVRALTMWITAIAALSLFIGGVGIMNIMLLSVTERMHEIGLRKAIGATRRQILGQFVLEATVLSVVGGIIGILLSLAVVGTLHTYTDLKPVVSWQAIGIATGVSLVIGVVFGVVPAVKAASKDPIEALRHE